MTIEATASVKRDTKKAIMNGLKCKCPNCGEGKLFGKWLKVEPTCKSCGEELHHERAQDFPPYITIVIVGHVVVTLLMIVEARWELSMTTHMLIWLPLATIMTFWIMQPIKGAVVGLQWGAKMFGFSGDGNEY